MEDIKPPRKLSNKQLFAFILPYLKPFPVRIILTLLSLVAAKAATVGVPVVMKMIVDHFTVDGAFLTSDTSNSSILSALTGANIGLSLILFVPVALLLAYGALRLVSTLFNELKEILYIRIAVNVSRRVMLDVFEHLHRLSMRFHAARQTGRLVRDVERGQKSIMTLADMLLFTVFPTAIETSFVLALLLYNYDYTFAVIAVSALVLYFVFTFSVTEWRTQFRRKVNEYDSRASAYSTDSLINFETVKHFGNERWELERYDKSLSKWESYSIQAQTSLSLLNLGQSLIITAAITLMLWRATAGVAVGTMSVGDLVLVSSLMMQLAMPLNFLGVTYRMIRQATADLESLHALYEADVEIADLPDAKALKVKGGQVRFENVSFNYEDKRDILKNISFTVNEGQTVALVGPSGAGKSTISKLLFRFYDVTSGAIYIDGQDIRTVTQESIRKAIGIVPQDTVLFNDTLGYNIAYGKAGATSEEIANAAKMAQLYDFITRLPDGFDTTVGERGLKLSGGEKQRVAIARTLLKNPSIYIFDEATSSLDSASEKQIQAELDKLAVSHTTLMIAHRLSTVVNADEILVIEHGRIAERGTHSELLRENGLYARMWQLQQAEKDVEQMSKGIEE